MGVLLLLLWLMVVLTADVAGTMLLMLLRMWF